MTCDKVITKYIYMKYILFTLSLLLINFPSFAQKNQPNLCELLKKVFDNVELIRGLEMDTTYPGKIMILDSEKSLNDCSFSMFSNKHNQFEIVTTFPIDNSPNYELYIIFDEGDIFFDVVNKTKKLIQIAQIKYINNKWKISNVDGGNLN